MRTCSTSHAHVETFASARPCLTLPTNSTKKLIDSSAPNPLIYIALPGGPSGLRPATGGAGRRENVQTESETCRLLAEMALSAVRKNPQEPAQTRGSRQKKPTPKGWFFLYWWWMVHHSGTFYSHSSVPESTRA